MNLEQIVTCQVLLACIIISVSGVIGVRPIHLLRPVSIVVAQKQTAAIQCLAPRCSRKAYRFEKRLSLQKNDIVT